MLRSTDVSNKKMASVRYKTARDISAPTNWINMVNIVGSIYLLTLIIEKKTIKTTNSLVKCSLRINVGYLMRGHRYPDAETIWQ